MKTLNVLTALLSGSMVSVSYAGTGKPQSPEFFAGPDADGSGYLTADEVREIH